MALHGNRVGRGFLRNGVVPLAVDLHDVPLLAGLVQGLRETIVAVGVDRRARHAAHFQHLAAARQMAREPLGPQHAKPVLVDVHVDRVFTVERIVERDQHDAGLLRAADRWPERGGILRVDDDRVVAGVDEIVDGRDLRRDVLAGRDDLEFLELGGHSRLRRIGLGRLDHLDTPGVRDIAVHERDAVRPALLRILDELRVGLPGDHTRGVAGRPGNDRCLRESRACAQRHCRGRRRSKHLDS
jgi:hypothetical protein